MVKRNCLIALKTFPISLNDNKKKVNLINLKNQTTN